MNVNDIEIKKLIDVVDGKDSAITKASRKVLVTNGIFRYKDASNNYVNINTLTKEMVIEVLAFLIEKMEFYDKACDELGLVKSFIWDGYSYNDWFEDLKNRVEYLKYEEKKKKVKKTKDKLLGLVSTEGKTAMELDAIKKSILEDLD